MLPDQLARVTRPPAEAGANACTSGFAGGTLGMQGIPHRYRHIPQPAFMADAANRAAFGEAQKFCFGLA